MGIAIRRAVLILAAASLVACATLPDFAAPRTRVLDPGSADRSSWISYRALTRDDFKAAEPPREFAGHFDQMGAATCAQIFTAPELRVDVQPRPSSDGTLVYHAAVRELRFHARMDRSCSWWNPTRLGVPEDYILEHEQIHFALIELEARRLNASLPEIEARLRATGTSASSATAAVERNLDEELQAQTPGILDRSRDFDEDTSMGAKPEQQKLWLDRVQAALAEAAD